MRPNDTHAEMFSSLGHVRRIAIIFHLAKARHEVPAGELQESLHIPGPTLSHHLDRLFQTGLIEKRRQHTFILYSINRRAVYNLARLLTACC